MAPAYKESCSTDDLDQVVSELRRRADVIAGMLRRMQDREIKAINVQGMKGVESGLLAIDKFILNCKRDLREF